ncbi:tyrosine-type recombinase/integrase [Vibrio diabolicus]|uniref:tyrosine-type recombinase/integrase n=2 Tax=Vibrio diabolicus TaxID=50719 RepID=UPI0035A96E50
MMDFFSFYSIKWVRTTEYPKFDIPIMFFDGEPAIGVNQWISGMIKQGITPSSLEEAMRAIGHLYNFHKVLTIHEGDDYDTNRLIEKFLDAKMFGTDQFCTLTSDSYLKSAFLGWKPVKAKSIKTTYLRHINDFDKFQSAFHGADRLNPSETVFLSSYEKYLAFKQRSGWDALLHLFPAQEHEKEEFSISVREDRVHKRAKRLQDRINKCFPADRFIELIETLGNPRDKLVFLMYGGGSLRRSEPLHTFFDDVIGIDNNHMLRVRLDDPTYGEISWKDSDGKIRKTTRKEYIEENYANEQLPPNHPLRHLQTRDQVLNRNDGLHSGFKGMTFFEASFTPSEASSRDGEVFWCSPEIGRYAARVFEEYMNTYIYRNPSTGKPNPNGWPWHPWLFIKITDDEYGLPLTISAINASLKRSLTKMGLAGKGYGLHSLRHLFGFYCATVLKIDITKLQGMLHHSQISSTQIYYHLSDATVRHELLLAHHKHIGEPSVVPLDLPAVADFNQHFKYQYPDNWLR